MTENNKVCFEDCKMFFQQFKTSADKKKIKQQLYLTQILSLKDFIKEGLDKEFTLMMLYDYLLYKQFRRGNLVKK